MESEALPEAIETVPIGAKLYPVANRTYDEVCARFDDAVMLSEASMAGKGYASHCIDAAARIALSLVEGAHAELTIDYVAQWMSRELLKMAFNEWRRQWVLHQYAAAMQRRAQRLTETGGAASSIN